MKQYSNRFCEVSTGERINYRYSEIDTQEKLPTLLLLHGNMSSSIHFQTLMAEIENSYQIIAPDLAGFGQSSYRREHNSLFDFALDIQALVEALAIEEFSVLGWSTGGGIALELAYLLPEKVKTVYLMSSVGLKGYPMFKKDANYQIISDQRLVTKEEISQDPVQVLPVLAMYQAEDLEGIRAIWNYSIYINDKPQEEEYQEYLAEIVKQRNLVDIDYSLVHFNITNESNGVAAGSGHLEGIHAKIVILHGDKDLVVPIEQAYASKEIFGGQAELHVFEGSGHALVQDNLIDVADIIIQGGR